MNQIFSFERCVQLVKHQFYKDFNMYKGIIALVILITGLLFWWAMSWDIGNDEEFSRVPIFMLFVMFFPIFYPLIFFGNFKTKNEGLFYFSLPVSSFERFVILFLFTMILFPTLMITIFSVFDFAFVHLYNHLNETDKVMYFITETPYPSPVSLFGLMMFLGGMSFSLGILLFSLFWKKGENIIFFIFPILYLLNRFVLQLSYSTIVYIFAALLPALWILMYFAIKRKEI